MVNIKLLKKYPFVKTIYDGTEDNVPETSEYEIKKPYVDKVIEKNSQEEENEEDEGDDDFNYDRDIKYKKRFHKKGLF